VRLKTGIRATLMIGELIALIRGVTDPVIISFTLVLAACLIFKLAVRLIAIAILMAMREHVTRASEEAELLNGLAGRLVSLRTVFP
jgi:hypothetical protein